MKYYLIKGGRNKLYRVRDASGKLVSGLSGEFWASGASQNYSLKDHVRHKDKIIQISEEQLALYKLGASPEGDIDG